MKHINYIGPFNRTGYGIASCGYLYGLKKEAAKHNISISFSPIGQIDQTDPELQREEYKSIIESLAVQPNWESPTVCFWHLSQLGHYLSNSKGPRIGITTFETSDLLPQEVSGLAFADRMIVACNHNKNILQAFDKRVDVIPHACSFHSVPSKFNIDNTTVKDFWTKQLGIDLSDRKIISTIGKFEGRKGFIELFASLFKTDLKYLLIGFWYNPFMEHNYPISYLIQNNWEPVANASPFRLYKKNNVIVAMMSATATRELLYNTACLADAYVCTSKAEGWNLPLFDILSFGMPTLSTTNSAMQDYAVNNVINLSTEATEVANDGRFFLGDRGTWEKLNIDHIAEKLQTSLVTDLSNFASESHQNISKLNYTWENMGRKLFETITNE